jgi:KaiC/GvpD/RAD55 family RecA-like ATPase
MTRTLTATFPTGKTVTRTTARAYTHVVMVTDALNTVIAWTSDPAKAEKREVARVTRWNNGNVQAFIAPVQA